MKSFRKTMPSGSYFLGDPSYVMGQDTYKQLMSQMYKGRQPVKEEGYFVIPGYDLGLVIKSTGDGGWTDEDGYRYGVDAGMIGLVSSSIAEEKNHSGSGRWIKSTKPLIFVSSKNMIKIEGGIDIKIDLSSYPDEEDVIPKNRAKRHRRTSTKKSKKGLRPSPSISATSCQPGQRKKGNDGNFWVVTLTSKGIHRWQKV